MLISHNRRLPWLREDYPSQLYSERAAWQEDSRYLEWYFFLIPYRYLQLILFNEIEFGDCKHLKVPLLL